MTASTKLRMLELLEREKGVFVPGQKIAERLGTTDGAIRKTAGTLREEGYAIDAVKDKGYRLAGRSDTVSVAGISKYLSKETPSLRIEVLESVDSTNRLLHKKAAAKEDEGYVLVATAQTEGRGRFGRSFHSPAGTGIYMSVLLRPDMPLEKASTITTAAAVSVCRALEESSKTSPRIKWVNDILIDGKKVCGILTEASTNMESGRVEYIVLGIGINVYEPEGGFPDELRPIAGAVFKERHDDARNRVIAGILDSLFRLRRNGFDSGEFMEEYRRRCLVLGKRIQLLSQDTESKEALFRTPRYATALDVDGEGRLLVRYEDGREEHLSSGEIRVVV